MDNYKKNDLLFDNNDGTSTSLTKIADQLISEQIKHTINVPTEHVTSSDDVAAQLDALRALDTQKQKTDAFIHALHSIGHVSHSANILSASDQQFQHSDELINLQALHNSTSQLINTLQKLTNIATEQIDNIYDSIDMIDVDKIATIQNVLSNVVELHTKTINSYSKLIQTERNSSNRLWGNLNSSSNQNNSSHDDIKNGNKNKNSTPKILPKNIATKLLP